MPQGPLIAVVNDDTAFLTMMNELLSGEGYHTMIWREGDGAYDLVRQHRPGLVILDIRMEHPGTGWQVLELLRLDPETVDIPVIVCSADSRLLREKQERLHGLNCQTLEKPFDLDELLALIRLSLGQDAQD
ncbi:MAG TPA: response regulator [Thermomicrobiaceae bacterium]|nr:response regulator [Thermomicrobiaceae bacterium]